MDSNNIVKLERRPWVSTDPRDKVRTIEELGTITQRLRQSGNVVVQAHGTFDLLHLGHVRHLEAARALGDALVVTVTGDAFVNKGPSRPAFLEGLRAEMLAALQCVDWILRHCFRCGNWTSDAYNQPFCLANR